MLDWDIFRALTAAANDQPPGDLDTRIRLLSTALDLIGDGGPFAAVPMGPRQKLWKWIDLLILPITGTSSILAVLVAYASETFPTVSGRGARGSRRGPASWAGSR